MDKIKESIDILLERRKNIHNVFTTIENISKRIENIETNFKTEVSRIEGTLENVIASQTFISKEFEKQKVVTERWSV